MHSLEYQIILDSNLNIEFQSYSRRSKSIKFPSRAKDRFQIWMSIELSENDDAIVIVGDELVVVDEDVGDGARVFAQDSEAANVVEVDSRF